ncbi:MAG: hypothetical protein K9G48_08970 [Reyranella sp.]|nr:hypothetical protein [Reyranella sp.]
MSLSSTANKVIHSGNGATTVWPFSFPVLEAGHLAVYLTDDAGLETVLSPSLYGVAGIGDPAGGSITYPLSGSPIGSGSRLTLLRTVPYTQTTVLSNQGGYYPEVVERRFDQIYMALQQLEERVGRASLYNLSNPTTEQDNHALIQQLQSMNLLTGQGDLLTRDGSAHKRLARGSAGQFLGVAGADLVWATPSQPVAPQGRLTLATGEPVMTGDHTGKTSLFYTPHVGASVPIFDGTGFVPTPFAERSNDLTQSATGKAGPEAAGPYQCIDLFIWNDVGTIRLTRGPKWSASAAVTMTIGSPCVVTWVGHGLHDGATVRFATAGALPTGLAANTDYFATKVDANAFRISTTLANQVAGAFINSSGTQSGAHTAANYTTVRGTGAGTTELERVSGILVNKYDIANGPAARMGTYVGTIYANSSSQMDFKRGGAAVGGGEAVIGVWNAYSRVSVGGVVSSSASTWVVANGTRAFATSPTFRATMVSGLAEDGLSGVAQDYITFDQATSVGVAVVFRSLTALPPSQGAYYDGGGWPATLNVHGKAAPFLGVGFWTGLEICTNFTSSYVINNGASTYVAYDWRY